ncbi:hypothetical protein SDRG_05868 [Saprolegnia diclina VS20]|uniref:WW domain-containing protein n=1 Tax=Saprolegnia diclina (strain VS20) TaxID=1156394 RepID=T0QNV7_SAPDV|nr:hypothetical protein SDRG_05868 [Saprolegnia diclina VS20]EQC36411.1 hypothetical protein SDRG_05868 [Saprolegnia diclina VS20]|eukprot:XP_008609832.1 hypothetical protein SDRG_05868 [Saprolegnia diclina VS20]
MSTRPKRSSTPAALIKSHDISTKQLMDDALVDHDVSEDGADSDDTDAKKQRKDAQRMYRINSYSSLNKLNKKPATPATPADGTRKPAVVAADGPCKKCLASKDMPSMHYAAYAGHLSCLQTLLATGIPPPMDKHKRTPLFYACAANQASCCAELLAQRPEWIDVPDAQLDSPVHVCCFFGWDACLEQLLDAGANPHVRNAKGFRPSHITKTPACLSILVGHGDDLLQGDKLGRTPLFVACTRDRVDCVEFLCSWDYQVHSWMLEQEDDRSDRPLHAAACNGSLGSLQVLLKYGADVYAKNVKGLTALDLAVTNQHEDCAALLRQNIKDTENAATWFAPSQSRHNVGPAPTTEWSECMDTDSGHLFYYNNSTGKCQWELPAGFVGRQSAVTTPAHLAPLPEASAATDPMPAVDDATSATATNQATGGEEDGGDYVWVKKKKTLITVVASSQSEWCVVQDPGSKAIYYRNTKTGESQWEEPEAIQKLQHDVHAHTSQHAAELWNDLNKARDTLAAKLEEERTRQAALTQTSIEVFQASIQQRREEMKQKELKTLLPKSSFVKAKRKPPSLKGLKMSMHTIQDVPNEDGPEDVVSKTIDDDPILTLFVGSFVRPDCHLSTSSNTTNTMAQLHKRSARSMQLEMTGVQRIYNCVFYYYLSLADPLAAVGMTKAQFRTFLKDALLLPNAATKGPPPPLKLHTSDMIYTQSIMDDPSLAEAPSKKDALLTLPAFQAAMMNVADRVVAQLDEKVEATIDDAGEWLCLEYILPLVRRLAGKMAETVKRFTDIEAQMTSAQGLLAANRSLFQALHKFYSSDSRFKLMTFATLVAFTTDFDLTPTLCSVPSLFHVCEAINWMSGNAYTVVLSYDKFVQICRTLAVEYIKDGDDATSKLVGFLTHLNAHRHNRATTLLTAPLVLPSSFVVDS